MHALWAELSGAGAVTTRYLTVGDSTAARSDGTNAFWLLSDRLGSVRDITNGSGTFVGQVEYTAFGGLLHESNSAVSGNVLFTGGYFDRLLGLYGMHWRSYDPQSGQWTTEDPSGIDPDVNMRRYVGNSATNGVDRNGLDDKNKVQMKSATNEQFLAQTKRILTDKAELAKELKTIKEMTRVDLTDEKQMIQYGKIPALISIKSLAGGSLTEGSVMSHAIFFLGKDADKIPKDDYVVQYFIISITRKTAGGKTFKTTEYQIEGFALDSTTKETLIDTHSVKMARIGSVKYPGKDDDDDIVSITYEFVSSIGIGNYDNQAITGLGGLSQIFYPQSELKPDLNKTNVVKGSLATYSIKFAFDNKGKFSFLDESVHPKTATGTFDKLDK